ncbi:MAG TPA: polyprenyl synthetase family protein [Chlorobaculum sp.]|nr:polyprenyl synthetase family protein [Chlorobaculum sp.]
MDIKEVTSSVSEELKVFQERYKSVLHSSNSLVDKVTRYVLKQQGKQIRPLLVLLSAKVCGQVVDVSYRGAIMIELLHSATLIHDDVVDGAEMRRGIPSINALWKNKISVLIGDYLLSKGLLYSLENNDFQSLRLVSEAVRRMSEGEILQIQKTRSLDITEDDYLSVIADKTGSLIATSCAIGAASSTSSEEDIASLKSYGEFLGLAFQIRDDLLDYTGDSKKTGKQLGIDIKDRKITLPLIFALQNSDKGEQNKIKTILKSSKKRSVRSREVIDFVRQKGGLDYAAQVAEGFADKALESISHFPESDAKRSLQLLVDFVMKRQH